MVVVAADMGEKVNWDLVIAFATNFLPMIVSTGVISLYIKHSYNKSLKSHEIKLGRYMPLIDVVARMPTTEHDWLKFASEFNAALCFASDDTLRELLLFNEIVSKARIPDDLCAEDFKPLLKSIRKDLDLKSTSLDTQVLKFYTGKAWGETQGT